MSFTGFSAAQKKPAVSPQTLILTPRESFSRCAVLSLAILFVAFLLTSPGRANTKQADQTPEPHPGWVIMPAGARSAYIGIHGGTVPVSLLTTSEGTSLVTFVGRTGNDFLDLLHRADLRIPSLLNATAAGNSRNEQLARALKGDANSSLMAGSPTSRLPVVYLTGEHFARLGAGTESLQPFGFSSSPLSIEGKIVRPDPLAKTPRYHLLVDPRYLQPRRN